MWGLRQIVAVVIIGAVGLTAAVTAAFGVLEVAVAAIGVLLAAAVALLVDLRRRMGQLVHRQRGSHTTAQKLRAEVRALPGLMDSRSERLATAVAAPLARAVDDLAESRERIVAERAATHEWQVESRRVWDGLAATMDALEKLSGQAAEAAAHADQASGKTAADIADVRTKHDDLRWRLRRLEFEPVRQVEALLQLYRDFVPPAPMPLSGGWALSPGNLLQLTHVVAQRRPGLVVECGSGTSSIWLGHTVRLAGSGRVVSLEHDATYAAVTTALVEEHGLGGIVEVRHAPLEEIEVGDQTFAWYSRAAWADLTEIGVLMIDGPPDRTGPQARYPAVPLLAHVLAANAEVFLDDAARDSERTIIERWLDEVPGLRSTGAPNAELRTFTYAPDAAAQD